MYNLFKCKRYFKPLDVIKNVDINYVHTPKSNSVDTHVYGSWT